MRIHMLGSISYGQFNLISARFVITSENDFASYPQYLIKYYMPEHFNGNVEATVKQKLQELLPHGADPSEFTKAEREILSFQRVFSRYLENQHANIDWHKVESPSPKQV